MKSWLPQLHFLQSSISPHNILFFFYLREGVLSNCLFLQRAYLYCHKWQCWFSQSMYASMAEASSHNIVAIITILQQKCLIACKHNTWQNYKYFQSNHVRLHNCATSNFLPMLLQICSYIFMPHYPLYRQMRDIIGSLTERGCNHSSLLCQHMKG